MLVVEAYRLDRYDNALIRSLSLRDLYVVEAYRLDRYDNIRQSEQNQRCRWL